MNPILAHPAMKTAASQIGGALGVLAISLLQGLDLTPRGGFAAFLNAHSYLFPIYVAGVSFVHNSISAAIPPSAQQPVAPASTSGK